ncbi:uncharacterized protein BP5553_04120 [Venustampulla echinocandica]|uniref:RING-type E3 ubiquitin transferase n=1 Tax=Venustampulla echinocandica TaxID=2656787 RepID=A0A370TW79_9HELO|nr:uncharacterized protein BP5553_04120 [Venustampulla echinocandica]RDL39780.1 hypothetical protein BP5553_04120 [Venustampulla echinocandica]
MAEQGLPAGSTVTPPDLFESILKHGTKEHRTILSTIDPSARHYDSRVTCTICLSPYFSLNDDGSSESPVVMPCGHYFGESCTMEWLQTKSTCPLCRSDLRFGCGHIIAPVEAFIGTPPNGILKICLSCSLLSLDESIAMNEETALHRIVSSRVIIGSVGELLAKGLVKEDRLEFLTTKLAKSKWELTNSTAFLAKCQETYLKLRRTQTDRAAGTWHMSLSSAR